MSDSVRFDAEATLAALRTLEADLVSAARQVLGQGADLAVDIARRTTRFKDHTTDLRESISRGQTDTWKLFVKAGGQKAPYALFVEDGTKPHAIQAKGGGSLRFVVGGHVVFRKSVQHPGTKPTDFMKDAALAAESAMAVFIEDRFAAMLR